MLFADDPVADPHGDEETPVEAKFVGDGARPLEEDQTAEGKDGENPVDHE